MGPEKAQLMSMIGGSDITPDITRCAACTKANATYRCAKCKVVKYCGRDCQAKHWKKGGPDPLVQNFFYYFDSVAKLGGCFLG